MEEKVPLYKNSCVLLCLIILILIITLFVVKSYFYDEPMALLINAELTEDFTNIMKIDKVNEVKNKFAQVLGGFGGLILLAVQIYRTVILNRQVKGNEIADRNREDQAKADLEEQRRSNISREILDQYVKAVDQLKDDNIAVRLGGIYSLEKIMNSPAKEAIEYHDTIIELMCAYIKDKRKIQYNVLKKVDVVNLEFDIIAILKIIDRRVNRNNEKCIIDLSNTNWICADLELMNFNDINFNYSHFNKASIRDACFNNVSLVGAKFEEAICWNSEFINCSFLNSNFSKSQFDDATITNAILTNPFDIYDNANDPNDLIRMLLPMESVYHILLDDHILDTIKSDYPDLLKRIEEGDPGIHYHVPETTTN